MSRAATADGDVAEVLGPRTRCLTAACSTTCHALRDREGLVSASVVWRHVPFGRRRWIAIAEGEVVGRHDLDARVVEALLDVFVEGRVDLRQLGSRSHER